MKQKIDVNGNNGGIGGSDDRGRVANIDRNRKRLPMDAGMHRSHSQIILLMFAFGSISPTHLLL